ncbi:hypothetical protein PCASD_20004 [Puccinia coronata f. sp. avenae]|uniref:Uncharacterized protein n=1 Tax=Puccinia coronata f. sp. avenae TaxID=200324 RepID=A0A2N5SCA8_9BASI|nr:hypothetical protein PCASD_20004 [Puccinia coronata f. sp. avenae]
MAAFILQSVHWAPTWTTVKRPAVPLWTSLHNGPAMVRQSGVPWSSFTHQKLDVLCTVQRRVHWASSGAHGVLQLRPKKRNFIIFENLEEDEDLQPAPSNR